MVSIGVDVLILRGGINFKFQNFLAVQCSVERFKSGFTGWGGGRVVKGCNALSTPMLVSQFKL